jgi:hypothetical protein
MTSRKMNEDLCYNKEIISTVLNLHLAYQKQLPIFLSAFLAWAEPEMLSFHL